MQYSNYERQKTLKSALVVVTAEGILLLPYIVCFASSHCSKYQMDNERSEMIQPLKNSSFTQHYLLYIPTSNSITGHT